MKWLISIISIFVLLIGVALIAPNFVNWNSYKDQIKSQILTLSGLNADLNGDLSVSILPSPRLYIEKAVVSNPQNDNGVIASIEQFEVQLDIGALIDKRIEVSSIRLVKPEITIEELSNGRLNFMTDEIEALQASSSASDNAASDKVALPVSFESIVIEEGAFVYANAASRMEISDVDLSVSAQTLQGPFEGDLGLKYADKPFDVSFKTGAIDMSDLSTSLNITGHYGDADFSFAGAVTAGSENPNAQGDVKLSVSDLAQYIKNDAVKGALEVSGSLKGDAKNVALRNLIFKAAGQELKGSVQAGLSPIAVSANLSAADVLKLDQFIPAQNASGSRKTAQSLAASLTQLVPQTLELPVIEALDVQLSVPGVVYQGKSFGGVNAALAKKAKGFGVNARVNDIPGKAIIELDADLSFDEVSKSGKSGSNIYSGGKVSLHLQGQAQNTPVTIEALSGLKDLPLVSARKIGVIDVKAHIDPKAVYLDEALVNLDDDAYSLKGSLSADAEGGSDLVTVSLVADALDVNDLMVKSNSSDSKNAANAGGLNLPFDVNAQASIHMLKVGGQDIKGLKVSTNIVDNKIIVKKVDADNVAGNALNINSDITIDMSGAKPYLQGSLALGELKWRGQKTAAQKKGTERWSSAVLDLTALDSVNMDFDVSAKSIDYEGWILSAPSIKLALKDGALNVSELKAGLYDGQFVGSALVQQQNGAVNLSSTYALSEVQIEPLVKSFAGNSILKGSGGVSVNGDVKSSGASVKALIGALSGQGKVNGRNIILQGIDVQRFVRALSDEAKPGDSLLNMWKGVGSGGSSQFATLDGSYSINNGVISFNDILLDGDAAAINTSGHVNLPAFTIASEHEMSVKNRDDVPSFTVKLSGPLDNPAQTFGQGLLQDYLQRKIQRKLQKELGDKINKELGNNPIGNVLQGVLGGGSAASGNNNDAANDNDSASEDEGSQNSGGNNSSTGSAAEDAVRGLLNNFMR